MNPGCRRVKIHVRQTLARSPNCFLSGLSPKDDLSWRWTAVRKKIREYCRRLPTAYRSNNCGLKRMTPSAERLASASSSA